MIKDNFIADLLSVFDPEVMAAELCASPENPFHTRLNMAEFVCTLKGHLITKDNIKTEAGGQVWTCDKCAYDIKIPLFPKPGEKGIYGTGTELNCPYAKRPEDPKGPLDMPRDMWEHFLVTTKRPAWDDPTSLTPVENKSEEYRKREIEQIWMNNMVEEKRRDGRLK